MRHNSSGYLRPPFKDMFKIRLQFMQRIFPGIALVGNELLKNGKCSGLLPAGLNASVDVTAGKAEDALLAPVEALRELSPGNYAVFVLVDGQLEARPGEVGLMDYTNAEIISGLEQGDEVSTGIVETE